MINSISWICFGDSIALGIAQAADLPCNAVEGRMPDAILAAIQATDEFFIVGRTVILSSGLSNNPDGREYVERSLIQIRIRGAKRIVLLGVGPSVRAGTNEWLAELSDRFKENVVFAGPLTNTRPDGIHPYYDQIVDQINSLLAV